MTEARPRNITATPSRASRLASAVHTAEGGISSSGFKGSKCESRMRTRKSLCSRASMSASLISFWSSADFACWGTKLTQFTSVPACSTARTASSGVLVKLCGEKTSESAPQSLVMYPSNPHASRATVCSSQSLAHEGTPLTSL